MSMTLKQDEWRQSVTRYITECRMAASEVLSTQMRLLLQKVILFTPPKTSAQGRKAIKGDLLGGRAGASGKRSGLFFVFDQEPLSKSANSVALFVSKDGRVWTVDSALYHPNASLSQMRAHHKAFQSPTTRRPLRGGVRDLVTDNSRTVNRMVVTKKAMARYLAHIWKRVGWTASGWVPGYHRVGGKAPNWIARHVKHPGYVMDYMNRVDNPSIAATNMAPNIDRGGEMTRRIKSAMQVRINSMNKDLTRRHKEAAKKAKLA